MGFKKILFFSGYEGDGEPEAHIINLNEVIGINVVEIPSNHYLRSYWKLEPHFKQQNGAEDFALVTLTYRACADLTKRGIDPYAGFTEDADYSGLRERARGDRLHEIAERNLTSPQATGFSYLTWHSVDEFLSAPDFPQAQTPHAEPAGRQLG